MKDHPDRTPAEDPGGVLQEEAHGESRGAWLRKINHETRGADVGAGVARSGATAVRLRPFRWRGKPGPDPPALPDSYGAQKPHGESTRCGLPKKNGSSTTFSNPALASELS